MSASEDGTIGLDQLVAGATQLKADRAEQGYPPAELIKNALKALDPDNTDFISLDSLRTKLLTTGEKLPPEDVYRYFSLISLNFISLYHNLCFRLIRF